MRTHKIGFVLPSIASVAILALAGCSSSEAPATDVSAVDAASTVTVDDPWVKAAEDGMTSSFGLVENAGEDDVTLIEVESSVSNSIELHQTSDDGSGSMSMEEKEGGFTITAGDTLHLAPGGNHIMFMDFDGPLIAGDSVDVTIVFSDGTRLDYDAAIRDFAGADESYDDDEHADHDDQGADEHGDHDDHGDDDLGTGDDLGGGDES